MKVLRILWLALQVIFLLLALLILTLPLFAALLVRMALYRRVLRGNLCAAGVPEDVARELTCETRLAKLL